MEKRLTDLPRARGLAVFAWLMLAIYACARILEAIPDSMPLPVIVALDVLSSVAFALVHGARSYGWRGILTFAAICLIVGNTIENIGVASGVPFGRYYFAGLMGPKILHVPILLGMAYIGMAYVSWMLARLIVGESDAPLNGLRLFTLPLVASFILGARCCTAGFGSMAGHGSACRSRIISAGCSPASPFSFSSRCLWGGDRSRAAPLTPDGVRRLCFMRSVRVAMCCNACPRRTPP